ncbi:Protein C2-DOMAIN ABA-RELATED 4 [Stylosanthes scabra]|uniref:Protein C2-DOMAIN ABA-RELATED 4 n=1 Tax=Stylosanthes scabra TaxID=79078 RepID=A0ABU6V6I9_9FABA|nr:Protein C2-DOMAIN ABA-RELATED 4 [Stylosanthes scabra]
MGETNSRSNSHKHWRFGTNSQQSIQLRSRSSSRSSSPEESPPKSLMENLMGLLRVRIKRGVNLAVRDVRSSDPYVVIKMGKQKLKTRVIKRDVNPEWNEDLTLSIVDPNTSVSLTIFDHDTFSKDDKMGDAEFEISTFIEALKMNVTGLSNGTVVKRIQPSRDNYLADESRITYINGKLVQDMILRLRNVECGELEIQLNWIDLPGSKGL